LTHQIAAWSKFTGEPIVARWVRLLTGRPQTQGPQDLWGQLRAIGLFLDTNFYNFRGLFCVMGGWQFKEVIAPKNAEGLAKAMASNVFQAKKIDWLPGLPRKDYSILDYQMSGEQKHQYKQMEEQFLLDIESGTVTVEVAIAKFAKLAQIQTGFIYDGEKIAHELVAPEDNPRLQLLLDLLEEEEGKVCVVYRHRPILPFLQRALAKWDPAYIAGQMKPDEVTEQKRRFNDEPSCRIILLQCDAAKYGHTLLGGSSPIDKCRDMIFFENSYSADTRDQIEDRIHRRGQTGERVHYRDLSGSDLDRRIVKALQRKDALYKSVFKNLRASKPQDAELERVTP
jgi:SNF2 family DNA or RNA helicase